MSTALNDQSRTVHARKLIDMACHADELHHVIQAAADRHDDAHLRLAAKSLEQLNDKLNAVAYDED